MLHRILTGALCAMMLTTPVYAATGDAAGAAKAVNTFALKSASSFTSESGSFFFSPYSILSALGMTWAGAKGETKTEMANALSINDTFHTDMGVLTRNLMSTLNGEDGMPLLTNANRIWIAKDLVPKATFANTLKHDYGASISRVNFKEVDFAKWQINSWVEAQTQGHIRDLIQDLSPEARMVLTNAVYFKGAWEYAFPDENTVEEPFYSSAVKTQEIASVPMMKQMNTFRYAEIDGVKLVRLPYAGGVDMLIALPGENNNIIPALAENNTVLFDKWLSGLSAYKVDLWLPRFSMEESYELKEILVGLGMDRAFSRFADFSAMAENEEVPLRIDSVVHKTFLDVNERETEAAAATGVVMMRVTSLEPPLPKAEFHADHPFVFFILDRATDAILFMGQKSF